MSKRLIVIVGCILVILLTLGIYINTPKNKANRALNRIFSDYGRLEGIVYTGFVDFEEDTVDINGLQYYVIKDECNSIDDLDKLLQKVYTKELASKILLWCTDGEEPILTEFEGKLCRKDAYAMGTPFILPINIANKINTEEIEIETELDGNELFVVDIVIKKEDGMWKIGKIVEREK